MVQIYENRHGVLLSTPSQTTHAFLPILWQLLGVGSEYGVSTIPSKRCYLGGCGKLAKWNLAGEIRAPRFWESFVQSWAMSPFCKGNCSALTHLPWHVDWSLRNHEPKSTLPHLSSSVGRFVMVMKSLIHMVACIQNISISSIVFVTTCATMAELNSLDRLGGSQE